MEDLQKRLLAAEDEACDLKQLSGRLETQLGTVVQPTDSAAVLPLPALEATLPLPLMEVPRPPASDAAEPMPSMLEIVTGQRDRFRERAGELEQERDRWRSSAEEERKRVEAVRADNVRLLERARYLQRFCSEQGRGGKRAPTRTADADLEGRYGAACEENLGPLEQFRQEEKAKRVAQMSFGERLLVTSGTLILASKPARLVALLYLSSMHLLVMIVVYKLAHKLC